MAVKWLVLVVVGGVAVTYTHPTHLYVTGL